MLELVAVLTVVFVGYVLYEVFKTVSSQSNTQAPASTPPPAAETAAVKVKQQDVEKVIAEAPNKEPEPTKAETEAKKVEAEPETKKMEGETGEAERAVEEEKNVQLRDPVSGETCPVPTNYRFAKKWVKDALVAEGLLDKVYKNADLDPAGSQKVKEALERFKSMPKYHG